MEIDLAQLPDWVYTAAIALLVAVIAYWNRERLGLGAVRMATREEERKVIDLQERQIELLQEEVQTLRRRVEHLENVVADYQLQVRILREAQEDDDGNG